MSAHERSPETMCDETIVLEKDRTVFYRIDLRWDGTNYSPEKFDAKLQSELRRRGGRSLSRFYTGDYGADQFEKFLRMTFKGIWNHPNLEDASFDDPTAEGSVLYPPRYLEFVGFFIDGAINISRKKCNYSVKQMRKFMSEGDRCLFGQLCCMTQGASAPHIMVHSMHGRSGSSIRSKLFENFSRQTESSTVNFAKLHGALHYHLEALKPFPFTLTENIRRWIGQFDILRCDMARQLNDEEAKAGCLQFGDTSFNAFVGYAADRTRNNCNGTRRRLYNAEIMRILMVE